VAISKSRVYRDVMSQLRRREGSHAQGFRRQARYSRSKGKVERPFRTVRKRMRRYNHFHQPENEPRHLWLRRYSFNTMIRHRAEAHSRQRLIATCGGDIGACLVGRFCAFAREPERRKVGVDAAFDWRVLYEVIGPAAKRSPYGGASSSGIVVG